MQYFHKYHKHTVFYMLVIENNVSLIDLTILTISCVIVKLVVNVFRTQQPVHFTVAPADENEWCRNNYLINLNVKVIELYFWVLCLNFDYFYRTNSYFCTTSLFNVHKLSKLKIGCVRKSETHVFKTILELFNCIFSSSLCSFQIFFW